MNTGLDYSGVIVGAAASQITSLTIVYSTVLSDIDQGKLQSSAPLAFVRGIHRGPVISPHKWPVTRKMFPFDDVIMISILFGPGRLLSYINISSKYSHLILKYWFLYWFYIHVDQFIAMWCFAWHPDR